MSAAAAAALVLRILAGGGGVGWVGVVLVSSEATDIRLQNSNEYHGLAPGKSAMLR